MDRLSGLTNARVLAKTRKKRVSERGERLTTLELHYKYALLKQLTRHCLYVHSQCMYVSNYIGREPQCRL